MTLFPLLLCLGWAFLGQEGPLPKDFTLLLNKTGLQYSMPKGFASTTVVQNPDVAYDFAMKSRSGDIEIRYRIWPADSGMQPALYDIMTITMALNISNGTSVQPTPYPPEAVQSEFGADAGCSAIVKTDSKFGSGYKLCLISALHKEGVGNAYVFFLARDVNTIMKALVTDSVYHALRFR